MPLREEGEFGANEDDLAAKGEPGRLTGSTEEAKEKGSIETDNAESCSGDGDGCGLSRGRSSSSSSSFSLFKSSTRTKQSKSEEPLTAGDPPVDFLATFFGREIDMSSPLRRLATSVRSRIRREVELVLVESGSEPEKVTLTS